MCSSDLWDWPVVGLSRRQDGGRVSWELNAWTLGVFGKPGWDLHRLPGWSSTVSLYSSWSFSATCEVRAAASIPRAELEGPVARLGLRSETVRDDGTHVVTRVLVTPLALALDTAFSPFELLAFLAWIAR